MPSGELKTTQTDFALQYSVNFAGFSGRAGPDESLESKASGLFRRMPDSLPSSLDFRDSQRCMVFSSLEVLAQDHQLKVHQ